MNVRKRIRLILISLLALTLMPALSSFGDRVKDEEKLGRDAAKSIEEQVKFVTDPAIVKRVERIGQRLADIASSTEVTASYGSSEIYPFKYQFKVIEDDDVNAFALPGGLVYVNSGLIDVASSDDEIAGVLAHEIAHVSHHHAVRLVKSQSKLDRYVALIALAGILGNARSKDLNNLLLGAQMLKIGRTSSQTQEAEKDADRTAVAYMIDSAYNPEALISFMKKLDTIHDQNPTVSLGIYQTHPAPYRRVNAITQTMIAMGYKLDTRKLNDIAYARCVPVNEGSEQYEVVISNRVFFTPASGANKQASKERAETIAKKINEALNAGLTAKDIREDDSGTCLLVKDTQILKVEPEDATDDNNRALLNKARSALERAVWADWLCNDCSVVQQINADN
ncbi:MAG: M48 family metalloprotease [Armatimonadota bacterium]|nr:M48 family metalloprotease [bacterium]